VGPASAQVRSTIVGPGAKQLPIAVSPLRSGTPAAASAASAFADIVSRDLELSGLFRLIPRQSFIEQPDTSGVEVTTINFGNWSVLGALAVVKGVAEVRGDRLVVEARLFDVARRAQLTGRRFEGGARELSRMANRFADDVLEKLTGERGPFDSRIAFLSTRGGRFKDVYVMDANGDDVVRLTRNETLNLSPSWGPRATQLLVTSYRNGTPDLFTLDFPGGQWKRFSSERGLTLGGMWSADGRRVAATRERNGNAEIVLLRGDGSLERQLTDHWAIDVSPSWSPDGRSLVFCSNRAGGPQIYVADAESGAVRRISYTGNYNTSPRWSPRGDRIAYVSRQQGRFQVYTVGVDGSGARAVTSGPGSSEDPSWSPDGRFLAYSGTRGGAKSIFLTDANGSRQTQLTTGRGDDTSPTWSGWLD
jgi:TolB protein